MDENAKNRTRKFRRYQIYNEYSPTNPAISHRAKSQAAASERRNQVQNNLLDAQYEMHTTFDWKSEEQNMLETDKELSLNLAE
jgi:hypothetical protein